MTKKILIFLFTFLIMVGAIIFYTWPDKNKKPIKSKVIANSHADSVKKQKRYADSVNRCNIIKMYDTINDIISKEWVKVNDTNCYIQIGLTTEPAIDFIFKNGRDFSWYNITMVNNYEDSLVLTTKNYKGDSILIWTFKPITKKEGRWSVYRQQTNKHKKLGKFIAQEDEAVHY